MYCSNCGNQVPDGTKYCPSCGAQLQASSQGRAAAPNYYNQQPAFSGGYAPAPAPSRALVTTKWPAVCGVMGVLYVVFAIFNTVLMFLYYRDQMISDSAIGSVMLSQIIVLILAIAVPVLFFVHTKKLAFLTAIPMVIIFIIDLIGQINVLSHIGFVNELILTNVIPLILSFILMVFYVIQMFVRSRSAALPVLYLIFSIIYVLYRLVIVVVGLVDGYPTRFLTPANLASVIGEIFLAIAYIVAMFSSKKR